MRKQSRTRIPDSVSRVVDHATGKIVYIKVNRQKMVNQILNENVEKIFGKDK